MKNNRFEVKNVMPYFNVWKEIFQPCVPPSVYLYIYMNLTHTSRDPGWLNWEFYYKTFSIYYWDPSGHTGDMC